MSIEDTGTEEGLSCSDVARETLGLVDDTNTADELGASKVLCEGIRGCQGEKPCQMTCREVLAATSGSTTVSATTTAPTATSSVAPDASTTAVPDATAWGESEPGNKDEGNPGMHL